MTTPRLRDIDYAAKAVTTALHEKFGAQAVLDKLQITAGERTIWMRDGARVTENTRDNLLAAIRRATTYEELWQQFPLTRLAGDTVS